MKKSKKDVYQIITAQIIKQLEAGTPPWRKSWMGEFGLAKNFITQKPYRGINMLLLNFVYPRTFPWYLSFGQIKNLGGKLKKGTKAVPVVFFQLLFKDEQGKRITIEEAERRRMIGQEDYRVIKIAKYYNVYNLEDTEGIDYASKLPKNKHIEPIEKCDKVLNSMKKPPQLVCDNQYEAYYSPSRDVINMPQKKWFKSSEDYYNVLFHELTHATGHRTRLARKGIVEGTAFGSNAYSLEELIAEVGASFLCGITGIDRTAILGNNSAYINGWLKKLKADKTFVLKAASEAQKAVDYILTNRSIKVS